MNITWDEADPRFLFGTLLQTCVRINGEDVGIWDVWRDHVDVCDWRHITGISDVTNVRSIPWEDVRELHVY